MDKTNCSFCKSSFSTQSNLIRHHKKCDIKNKIDELQNKIDILKSEYDKSINDIKIKHNIDIQKIHDDANIMKDKYEKMIIKNETCINELHSSIAIKDIMIADLKQLNAQKIANITGNETLPQTLDQKIRHYVRSLLSIPLIHGNNIYMRMSYHMKCEGLLAELGTIDLMNPSLNNDNSEIIDILQRITKYITSKYDRMEGNVIERRNNILNFYNETYPQYAI